MKKFLLRFIFIIATTAMAGSVFASDQCDYECRHDSTIQAAAKDNGFNKEISMSPSNYLGGQNDYATKKCACHVNVGGGNINIGSVAHKHY